MASSKTAMHEPAVLGQKSRQVWTPEEDQRLSEAVAKGEFNQQTNTPSLLRLTSFPETPKQGPVSWHKVASHMPGRNNKDCRKRWHYGIANSIRKGTWLEEEDQRLREAVQRYGTRWSKIAEAVGTRNGDQCWKRWYDCLDPRIDKSPWTSEEVCHVHPTNLSNTLNSQFVL
jgi:myb proto-oncogene protein